MFYYIRSKSSVIWSLPNENRWSRAVLKVLLAGNTKNLCITVTQFIDTWAKAKRVFKALNSKDLILGRTSYQYKKEWTISKKGMVRFNDQKIK